MKNIRTLCRFASKRSSNPSDCGYNRNLNDSPSRKVINVQVQNRRVLFFPNTSKDSSLNGKSLIVVSNANKARRILKEGVRYKRRLVLKPAKGRSLARSGGIRCPRRPFALSFTSIALFEIAGRLKKRVGSSRQTPLGGKHEVIGAALPPDEPCSRFSLKRRARTIKLAL